MVKFFIGTLVGICLVLLAEYLYVVLGGISMSTAASPLPAERYFANHAISASIGDHAHDQAPVPADEANLLEGARVFSNNGCAGCHGHYGQGPSGMAKRVYPHIPALLPPGKGVTDDPVGTTHWVVENGIRFSAMPRFEGKLSDKEIWQVSLLLRNADKLSPAVQQALKK